MSNSKRIRLKCWNAACGREYTLLREFEGQPQLFVACPYCLSEGVVDLAPWRSKTVEIYQGESGQGFTLETLDLPAVLPTRGPAEEEAE